MDSLWVIFWCPAPAISPEEKKEERSALEVAMGNIGNILLDLYWLVVQKDNVSPGLQQPLASPRAAAFLAGSFGQLSLRTEVQHLPRFTALCYLEYCCFHGFLRQGKDYGVLKTHLQQVLGMLIFNGDSYGVLQSHRSIFTSKILEQNSKRMLVWT